jgi:hypothetical protein
VKLVELVSAAVVAVPLVGWLPDQPPEAAQLVAFAALHVNVEVPPLATLVGFAVKETTGAGSKVTWTV